MAVLNVEDGPGPRKDREVELRVADARASGVQMLGYVDTAHGTRPTGEIFDEIARYRAWYGTDGVFFDQAHVPAEVVRNYYRPLYRGIKEVTPNDPVVLNAGATMPRSVMAAADILANFEGDYPSYQHWAPPVWASAYKASRFWHIVYGIPSFDALDEVLSISLGRRAGWLYATDQHPHEGRPGAHLYDRLPQPEHWARFLQGLATALPGPQRVRSPASLLASIAPPIGNPS